MKQIIKGLIVFISVLLFSCAELDIAPKSIVSEAAIFSSEAGVMSYIATMYADVDLCDFYRYEDNITAEESKGEFKDAKKNWNYSLVRNLNAFIAALPNYAELHKQANLDIWMGEAKFMLAMQYFQMVRMYGGIPLITETQEFTGDNLEELQVPRNKEKEIYEFIRTTLDEAIALLPEEAQSSRASKYAALALKSRAMLYAGSIAEYGEILLDGVIGIPAGDANTYYQYSYDASKAIEGKFSLYAKHADKTENFIQLFLDSDIGTNPEVIFSRVYQYPLNGHKLDRSVVPFGIRGPQGYGSRINPTLTFVEMFEYIDGTPGTLVVDDESGEPIRFENPLDLFNNKDPRCAATVIYPYGIFKDQVIDVRKGIYESYPDGPIHTAGSSNQLWNGMAIIGKSGIGGSEQTRTGFHLRKYSDPRLGQGDVRSGQSNTDWIEFRYAEILLNLAEAGFVLGKTDEALGAINQIRERAGIALITSEQLTTEKIQHERTVELAMESQSYWDERRWRTASDNYYLWQPRYLYPYYIFDEGVHIFKITTDGNPRNFETKRYWRAIEGSDIQKNPKLIQNPYR